jgi:hypothetical protein
MAAVRQVYNPELTIGSGVALSLDLGTDAQRKRQCFSLYQRVLVKKRRKEGVWPQGF